MHQSEASKPQLTPSRSLRLKYNIRFKKKKKKASPFFCICLCVCLSLSRSLSFSRSEVGNRCNAYEINGLEGKRNEENGQAPQQASHVESAFCEGRGGSRSRARRKSGAETWRHRRLPRPLKGCPLKQSVGVLRKPHKEMGATPTHMANVR